MWPAHCLLHSARPQTEGCHAPLRYHLIYQKFGLRRFWDSMGVWMGTGQLWCGVNVADHQGVPVYFIEHNEYFGRDGLYHDAAYNDYQDNPYRLELLSRAGLQLARDMSSPILCMCMIGKVRWPPSISKRGTGLTQILGHAASVLTIHNIAYQGIYDASCYPFLGLGWNNSCRCT